MRIEDKDIIALLEREGPSTVRYLSDRMGITNESDRSKLAHHLKMLAVYKFIIRDTQSGHYIYKMPGDERPVNYPPNHTTPKQEKLRELIDSLEPGEVVDRRDVQRVTGYSRKWIFTLMNRTELDPIEPNKKTGTQWRKGAGL